MPNSKQLYVWTAALIVACSPSAQTQRFTVRDSIELTTFNEPSELLQDTKPIFSPDGKHFLIVTSRGIVDTDQVESKLWIYNTTAVQSFLGENDSTSELKPRLLAKVVGSPVAYTLDSYGGMITDPRWNADSLHFYFLRQAENGDRELCESDRQTRAVKRLTPIGYDISRYAVTAGMTVALIQRQMRDDSNNAMFFGRKINKSARDVTGLPISTILFPDRPEMWQQPMETRLWTGEKGKAGRIIQADEKSRIDFGVVDLLSISPRGHWLARLLPVNSVPQSWANYEPNPVLSFTRIDPHDPRTTSPANLMRLKSYALIDLHTGKEAFRIDAPNARPLGLGLVDEAIWSPDESRLLLINTYLPLKGVSTSEREERRRPCVALDVELGSRKLRCIKFSEFPKSGAEPPDLREVSFGATKDEVVLRYFNSTVERYRLEGNQWILKESSRDKRNSSGDLFPNTGKPLSGIKVTIRQSLNSSPTLWAEDVRTGRHRQMWNPNPQLSQMKLGNASVYHWKDRNGVEWTGGLIKPVGYIADTRYPLVIQTHGFSEETFKDVTDGAYPTAMAARPLASAGMMVLQVPDYHGKEVATAAEAEVMVEAFRSAIDQLTSEGLIDPKRVGVIGFSRTCWYVETALIDYPAMFAAAAIADGVDMSYIQYHLFFDGGLRGEFEQVNQSEPFGDGLRQWLRLAPGFRLDKVKTPLRIEAIGQRSLLREWEIYSSLRLRGTPTRLIYIPEGQHILQRPQDRMASQEGNVEWFQHWLEPHQTHRLGPATNHWGGDSAGPSTLAQKRHELLAARDLRCQ